RRALAQPLGPGPGAHDGRGNRVPAVDQANPLPRMGPLLDLPPARGRGGQLREDVPAPRRNSHRVLRATALLPLIGLAAGLAACGAPRPTAEPAAPTPVD